MDTTKTFYILSQLSSQILRPCVYPNWLRGGKSAYFLIRKRYGEDEERSFEPLMNFLKKAFSFLMRQSMRLIPLIPGSF